MWKFTMTPPCHLFLCFMIEEEEFVSIMWNLISIPRLYKNLHHKHSVSIGPLLVENFIDIWLYIHCDFPEVCLKIKDKKTISIKIIIFLYWKNMLACSLINYKVIAISFLDCIIFLIELLFGPFLGYVRIP